MRKWEKEIENWRGGGMKGEGRDEEEDERRRRR